MLTLKLSRKQKIALDLLDDPQVTEIYYGGSAGSGKTLMLCIWMLKEMRQYPGIRIGLGRKELTRLKQTTVTSLLREAHPMMLVKQGTFNYQDQKGLITYQNGSSIQLIDLARQPSDADYDTLGSLNLTHVVIDEGGEIVKKAKDVLGSRKNRFLNDKYGIVGKTVITGNPSQNFTREEYYDPYLESGGGDYQKWPTGEVVINDQKQTAYKAFIKALPTDNPFLPQNYIEVLKQLPSQERKRLYEGNWDYLDDDDMLFKSTLIERSLIGETSDGSKYIGVDVADKGKDSTIATLIVDGVITLQRPLKVDTTREAALSELTALELIKFAQMNGFTGKDARNIAVESNGVGVGVRDFMRSKGWFVSEYVATGSTRSQALYDMAQSMDKGDLKIHSELDTLNELRKQLMVLTYEFKEDLTPKVLEKKKVKEILGYSPDHADSAYIAHWVAMGAGSNAKKPSRVIW